MFMCGTTPVGKLVPAYIPAGKMDFLHHGSRAGSSQRDFGYDSLQLNSSPMLSRRRSASPLVSPASGSMTPQLLVRNRQEPSFPQTDDEQLHLFHERIVWNQEKSLLPLAHDLADWMNSILGVDLTSATLMERLENGVILYQLAKLIEEKAGNSEDAKVKPKLKGKVRINASRGSFFARDNVAMFLKFCRDLGVHNNLLFETEDLVSHGEVRSVLICLMEVGRLACKYGIDPPVLVAMERQIENDEKKEAEAAAAVQLDSGHHDDHEEDKENPKLGDSLAVPGQSSLSDSIDSGLPENEDHQQVEDFKGTTELDIKVNEVARISGKHCCCVEETRRDFKLRKISEGKYLINGRTVFVRLLKGVHVMVRIGGGWETLEEFLVRNDPCRGKRSGGLQRRASFGVGAHRRPASSPAVVHNHHRSTCSTPARSRHSSRNSLFH